MTSENSSRNKGYAIHLFTSIGAILGLLALQAVMDGDAREAMLWLVASQFLDGLDGSIARRFNVKIHAPRIDGNTLDLVIDYVTCVVVPTIFMLQFEMLPASYSIVIASFIFVSSALWFSRPDIETDDFWFRGFPAVWNLVVVTMYICSLSPVWVAVISVLLGASQLTSVQVPHVVRARWMRKVSFPFGVIYACALTYLSVDYPNPIQGIGEIARIILVIFPAYILGLSLIKTFVKR